MYKDCWIFQLVCKGPLMPYLGSTVSALHLTLIISKHTKIGKLLKHDNCCFTFMLKSLVHQIKGTSIGAFPKERYNWDYEVQHWPMILADHWPKSANCACTSLEWCNYLPDFCPLPSWRQMIFVDLLPSWHFSFIWRIIKRHWLDMHPLDAVSEVFPPDNLNPKIGLLLRFWIKRCIKGTGYC